MNVNTYFNSVKKNAFSNIMLDLETKEFIRLIKIEQQRNNYKEIDEYFLKAVASYLFNRFSIKYIIEHRNDVINLIQELTKVFVDEDIVSSYKDVDGNNLSLFTLKNYNFSGECIFINDYNDGFLKYLKSQPYLSTYLNLVICYRGSILGGYNDFKNWINLMQPIYNLLPYKQIQIDFIMNFVLNTSNFNLDINLQHDYVKGFIKYIMPYLKIYGIDHASLFHEVVFNNIKWNNNKQAMEYIPFGKKLIPNVQDHEGTVERWKNEILEAVEFHTDEDEYFEIYWEIIRPLMEYEIRAFGITEDNSLISKFIGPGRFDHDVLVSLREEYGFIDNFTPIGYFDTNNNNNNNNNNKKTKVEVCLKCGRMKDV